MNKINEQYEFQCRRNSDINEHLPTLKKYSEECDHITEMGVRDVVSTWAFLIGHPKKLISYDICQINQTVILDAIKDTKIEFQFILGDTTKIEIEETDLLFIDTEHNYLQLKTELLLHGNKSKKYLIFHDTVTFGETDSNAYNNYENLIEIDESNKQGLNLAIQEFINNNPQWSIHEVFENCCGLTILKRNDENIK
jgi:hypothetical protein